VSLYTSGTATTGYVGPGIAQKFQVVVFYQQKDLSLFPAGYTPGSPQAYINPDSLLTTTTSSTSSSGGTSSGPIETLVNTEPPSDQGPTGLSTGAKAGIGAGVGLVVIFILLALYYLIIVRRRRLRAAKVTQEPEYQGTPELDVTPAKKDIIAEAMTQHNLAGDGGFVAPPVGSYELDGNQQILTGEHVAELDEHPEHGRANPAELPGPVPTELAGPYDTAWADQEPSELAGQGELHKANPSVLASGKRVPYLVMIMDLILTLSTFNHSTCGPGATDTFQQLGRGRLSRLYSCSRHRNAICY
jgi:hypothetical protein